MPWPHSLVPALVSTTAFTHTGGANVHKRENAQAEESTRGDFSCSELSFFWTEGDVILHPFKSGIIQLEALYDTFIYV